MKPGTLVIALTLIAAPLAWSLEDLPPQNRAEAFRQLDKDGDGWISREEAAAHPEVAAGFDKADQDRDGRLSLAEFATIALNRSDQPGKFRTPERG
jgi:EF-hand domain pair